MSQLGRRILFFSLGILGIAIVVGFVINVSASSSVGDASLTIEVTGVANTKGKIFAAVCDKTTFLKQCEQTRMEPAAAIVALNFSHLKSGSYAVMVFHDENNNQKFDKTSGGIPLEGYGFSRNAKGRYGPPMFEDAMIDVESGNNIISIKLVY